MDLELAAFDDFLVSHVCRSPKLYGLGSMGEIFAFIRGFENGRRLKLTKSLNKFILGKQPRSKCFYTEFLTRFGNGLENIQEFVKLYKEHCLSRPLF